VLTKGAWETLRTAIVSSKAIPLKVNGRSKLIARLLAVNGMKRLETRRAGCSILFCLNPEILPAKRATDAVFQNCPD